MSTSTHLGGHGHASAHGVPLPPVLFLSCLIGGGLLHLLWPRHFIFPSFWASFWSGLTLFAGATILGASTLSFMRRAGTPHHPRATPRVLVRDGPFRRTRNPLYLALVIILTGFGFLLNSLWLVLAVPVLVTLLTVFVIRREEVTLEALFGSQYIEYRRQVRRWA